MKATAPVGFNRVKILVTKRVLTGVQYSERALIVGLKHFILGQISVKFVYEAHSLIGDTQRVYSELFRGRYQY